MGEQRRELGLDVVADVLHVVDLVGLPQQQGAGPVRRNVLFRKEVRVAGGDDAVGDEQAGVAVVGVQPVALPRVVTQHDVGLELPDPVRDLGALAKRRLELAVGPAKEDDIAVAAERTRRGALLVLTRGHEPRRVLVGSHEPFDPSVHTTW